MKRGLIEGAPSVLEGWQTRRLWLGDILKNSDAIQGTMGLPENLELMAVVAFGHPLGKGSVPFVRSRGKY